MTAYATDPVSRMIAVEFMFNNPIVEVKCIWPHGPREVTYMCWNHRSGTFMHKTDRGLIRKEHPSKKTLYYLPEEGDQS